MDGRSPLSVRFLLRRSGPSPAPRVAGYQDVWRRFDVLNSCHCIHGAQAVQRGAVERQEAGASSQRLQSDVRLIEQTSLRQARDLAEKERAISALQNKVGCPSFHVSFLCIVQA